MRPVWRDSIGCKARRPEQSEHRNASKGAHCLETAQRLDELSKLCGMSRKAVLEKVVHAYVRDQFLIKANEECAYIKANPDVWPSQAEELKDWDITLNDGLEDA